MSFFSFEIIASFNAGIPSTGVYFVLPSFIATMAAFLICSGVSKSGSPAVRVIIGAPFALSSRAFMLIAMVADNLVLEILFESSIRYNL